jgi:hypothetical protein
MHISAKEIWRAVPGLPYYYQVSNRGRMRSLARKDKRGWNIKTRYMVARDRFLITNEGNKIWCPFAALVLKAFVGPPPDDCYLSRHLDDDRSNNKVSNLAWGTDADNSKDAIRNGRSFASYGHLGKKHSLKTKKLLSDKFKGRPTGRKISPSHRKALLKGYRIKFPEKPVILCLCGCGEVTRPGKKFRHGHSGRIRFRQINKDRIGKARTW